MLLKRDVQLDDTKELTQQEFNSIAAQLKAVMLDYKEKHPESFKKFCDDYFIE